MAATAAVLLLAAAGPPAAHGQPAQARTGPYQTAQARTDEETIRRFRSFLGSWTYSTLIAKRALDNDDALPPTCGRRRVVGRRIVALPVRPEFIPSREVPVAGEWVERVAVRRCGRVVHHNIFVSAHRVRGLVARPGFPGNTRAGLDLQVAVAKAVLKRVLASRRGCRRVDIVNTQVLGRPTERYAPWREAWSAWACGRRVQQTVTFTPARGGRTRFRLE